MLPRVSASDAPSSISRSHAILGAKRHSVGCELAKWHPLLQDHLQRPPTSSPGEDERLRDRRDEARSSLDNLQRALDNHLQALGKSGTPCDAKETEAGMEEDNVDGEGIETAGKNISKAEALWEILRPAMKGLAEGNTQAYDILRSLVEEGSIEQHQTSGALDAIADRLLGTVKSGEGADAD